MTTKNNLTAEKHQTITIKRTFDLPVNIVWNAWTNPESCKKWWAPKNYTCPDCSIDFKTGGKYLISMQGEDGKKIWSTGTYKEIVPYKKIVFTDHFSDSSGNVISASDLNMPGEWPSELIATLELEENNGKTNMHLTHEGIPPESYDDCITGWQEMFDKLDNIKE